MILVTTPTGDIGSQVLSALVETDQEIRVIARHPSKLAPEIHKRVEIIEGSHGDRAVVERAFDGADAVFWLAVGDPSAPNAEAAYADFSRPACGAIRSRGVKRVVGVSALGRGWPNEAGHVTATHHMDDMLAATGANYRALACGSLMENIRRQAALIRDRGVFYWPSKPDFKIPVVATRDIAAVAVRFLLDPTWQGSEIVPMMGPEDLSFDDMAQIMSEVLGKTVRFQEMSMEDMKSMLLGRGTTEGMAQAMIDMLTAINQGMNNLAPRSFVAAEQTTFRQWCELVLMPAVAG